MPLMAGPADMDLARQNYGATMNETYWEKNLNQPSRHHNDTAERK